QSGPANEKDAALNRTAQFMTGMPVSTASKVELLIDGGPTYDALVKAIEAAQQHIHVEYYIFLGDRTGTRIRDALIERARAGVKVRVLLDGIGSRLSGKFTKPLKEAGAELAFFHPVRWWMTFFARPKINMRSHRKIVICDGKVGFTGGINVTDDENDQLKDDAFHDMHMRLEGEVVRWLQIAWLEDWHYATQKQIELDSVSAPAAKGPISAQVIPAGPDNAWEPVHRVEVSAIHRAQSRVWLATPYFVPSRAALFALEAAAMRGLDVRVLVPKRSDSRMVTPAARSYFDRLLKAGVRIFEYGPRMLHTKALLVDDEISILGTSNFDARSFALNFEIVVLFCDAGVATNLSTSLAVDLAAASEVTKDSPRPSFLSRLSEGIARLFSPIL
ncbi:MAG: cardiolipin synthase, partial [Dokdonella sp.]